MTVEEKKKKFIEAWGNLGTRWGINKTMARIHALLLFECCPMCSEEIMKQLDISTGNVNMNLRCLVDWELVYGVSKDGHRKEFFIAERDMWQVFKKIIKKRKEQELAPLQNLLTELIAAPSDNTQDSMEFDRTLQQMKIFADKADGMLTNLTESENSWLIRGFKMMMR